MVDGMACNGEAIVKIKIRQLSMYFSFFGKVVIGWIIVRKRRTGFKTKQTRVIFHDKQEIWNA
jgi:hypothetical protein